MIKSSTQVMLADGRQEITFNVTTNPTNAFVTWVAGTEKNPRPGSTNTPVFIENGKHMIRGYFAAEEFEVKLDTEDKIMTYTAEWGNALPEEADELEIDGGISNFYIFLQVPYCDLTKVDVRLYTSTNEPLEIWDNHRKKAWDLASISVRQNYGAATLIATLRLTSSMRVKRRDGVNWTYLSSLPGGCIVEIVNHSRVTTDRVVNATICRDSLYGKKYRRVIPA